MTQQEPPSFPDLRTFLKHLEKTDQLTRIAHPVSVVHEVTEVHRRVLRKGGPVLLFEQPVLGDGRISPMPLAVNLFGTIERVALGLGVEPVGLEALGAMLAWLRHPEPPRSARDVLRQFPMIRAALNARTAETWRKNGRVVLKGDEVDLGNFPIQTCWPDEPAPLITWPLVITSPPGEFNAHRTNVGVYRLQVLGRNRLIARWLTHRGGAVHHALWRERGEPCPVAIAIGASPSLMLAAAMPVPESVSEFTIAGLLARRRLRLTKGVTVPLFVPEEAEIVIEGYASPTETAPEGPYGDHTGYYNTVEPFPVIDVTAITHRRAPIYVSTYTGRPPDEPSIIGEAFNRIFVPLIRKQFPEVVDFYLPPEACSYRVAIVSMRKRYPGQARRLMLGLWSMLPQLTYTKMIIVVDEDIDVRSWPDVMWAVATRSDTSRDAVPLTDTPIDYLDFASPKPGLGGKLGIDATNKIEPETAREWGKVLAMTPEVVSRIDGIWEQLGLEQ